MQSITIGRVKTQGSTHRFSPAVFTEQHAGAIQTYGNGFDGFWQERQVIFDVFLVFN
ncbi:hypothetical protein [Endozoicomonas sp. SCSIO W0465]|uniref:hypothetical protein n=1 Tax=Endozoicomonas sp. SCSIO W0465 TaxID=2918516 RepID=UPI002075E731|nr:hypothetical protein [Endozoicomonas sp. SCSIO W0465]USE34646.1 hypothetical protein MJO57_21260 [Endozoicomonas sp. SCSIO W0465]